MARLEPTQPTAPARAAPSRCAICKRFARLALGQTRCAACRGELPLDFQVGGR